jgi:hypothetical protein
MINMRTVQDGEELFTVPADGEEPERLLFTADVARIAGTQPDTITGYHSKAKAKRRRRQPSTFPVPDEYVWRIMIKSDNKPLRVRTPVWRESRIRTWDATERLGPGGRVRKAGDGQADGAAARA